MKKTFDRFNRMMNNFSREMDETFEEMNKEIEDLSKNPLPEGVNEVVTEETETRPDGTVIHRKVTRRTSIT